MTTPPVFSYHCDPALRRQLGQSPVWNIALVYFTSANLFPGACGDGTFLFPGPDYSICRSAHVILMPHVHKIPEHVVEALWSWLFEGSYFYLVRLVVSVARPAEFDWRGLAPWMRDFRTVRKLVEYSTCSGVIQPICISFHIIEMFHSLLELYRPVLLAFLSPSRSRCQMLVRGL